MNVTSATESFPDRLGYRPPLDGLRALAVLAVMASHAHASAFRGGALGVDVFFVLSGFLITTLLVQERRGHGHVALGRFYARRALRLLPAMYAMLAVLSVYALTLTVAERADAFTGIKATAL